MALEFVKPGDLVMEIGAGVGITGMALAKASQRPIILVEPNSDLYPTILRNFEINGLQVHLCRAAAVADDCRLTDNGAIVLHKRVNYWWSSISNVAGEAQPVVVQAIALSALLNDHRPNVLVIDVEGAEVNLLKHGLNPCVRKLFLEIHTPEVGSAATSAIVATLHRQGFDLRDQRAHTWYLER